MLISLNNLELNAEQFAIFEELYLKHYSDLVYFAKYIVKSQHIAEEITQEAFIKIIEKMRLGELDLSCPKKARNFMVTIVKNKALTVYTKEKGGVVDDIDKYSDRLEDPKLDLSNVFEAKENVIRWLKLLTEEERELLMLRIFYDWSFKEIAIAKEMNENTVRSRFFRTKNKLAKIISEGGELDGSKQ